MTSDVAILRLKLGCIKLQGIGRDLERLYILYFEIRVTIKRKDEGSVCTEGQIIMFFAFSQNSFFPIAHDMVYKFV